MLCCGDRTRSTEETSIRVKMGTIPAAATAEDLADPSGSEHTTYRKTIKDLFREDLRCAFKTGGRNGKDQAA